MEYCNNCIYRCLHKKNTQKVCWNCFTANHLIANVFKIDGMDFFLCNEEIREKMIDHPGYFLCYNYQNKIYKLIKVQDLVYANFYLIKHIVAAYFHKLSKKTSLQKVNDMSLSNCSILEDIFKQKYALDMDMFQVVKL